MNKTKSSTIAIVILSVLLAAALATTVVLAAFTSTSSSTTTVRFASGLTLTLSTGSNSNITIDESGNVTISATELTEVGQVAGAIMGYTNYAASLTYTLTPTATQDGATITFENASTSTQTTQAGDTIIWDIMRQPTAGEQTKIGTLKVVVGACTVNNSGVVTLASIGPSSTNTKTLLSSIALTKVGSNADAFAGMTIGFSNWTFVATTTNNVETITS
jgi:hypothetical protein